MPGGRPTRYLKKYCDEVIPLGKVGMSKMAIAANLGVTYRTVLRWIEAHPEFSHAMEDAMAFSQVWWEEQGRIHLTAAPEDAKINAALYSRSMAARFPKTWREKSEIKQDVTVATLTESERAAKLSGLLDSARARGAGRALEHGSEEVDADGGSTK